MEKVKKLIFLLAGALHASFGLAQEILKPGLTRAQLTLSPSYNFHDKQSYFYLHGNAEVYLEKQLSLAGEGYYYLGNLASANAIFAINHSLFFGASYHFLKNNNDLYVGFQPGISITRLMPDENNISNPMTGVNPLFSAVCGYNLYVHRFFHFFVQSRLVIGQHQYDLPRKLTEFRLSAGLGFNL